MMKSRNLAMWLVLSIVALLVSANANAQAIHVGDVIRIALPGEESLDRNFDVDRAGRIQLPEVGAIKVAGIDEADLPAYVRNALSGAFRDLSSMRVFVQERRLLVTVLGYVKAPGEVVLPAGASVQMALQAAGGLRAGAQLDRIQLRREQQRDTFDYKRYLDSGDTSLLPELASLDTLFVPASPIIGNVEVEFDPSKVADGGDAASDRNAVKVFGEVSSPGSFSFKPDITLVDLLMRAGGVTRYAGVEQIRVITDGAPKLFNLKRYLDTGNAALLPTIRAGATIFVPIEEESVKGGGNTVYVMGEVFKPGAYEGRDGASFMDILANAGGPTRFAESGQIRILKANGQVQSFDLAGFTKGTVSGQPPRIEAGDAIFVPENTDLNEKSWLKVAPARAVRVIGEVVRPGRIEWSDEMTLLDLLAHVGGPTRTADTSGIEVLTPDASGRTATTVFNLDEFVANGRADIELPAVRAGTTVRVHELPTDPRDNKAQWVRQSPEKSIYIFGQVGAPGRYMFTDAMGFLDILAAADGPNGNADLRNIRISHREGKYARVSKLNLALYFETGDENLLPAVQTGDTIYIPEKNRSYLDRPKEHTVRVLGAVNEPGRYAFDDSMSLLDLLAEARGTSPEALVEKITVVNLSCCKSQARVFDLKEFASTADFTKLPVLRAGDTVYVPTKDDGLFTIVRQGVTDLVQVFSLAALLGLL